MLVFRHDEIDICDCKLILIGNVFNYFYLHFKPASFF